jgi:hypothetical protein
VSITIFRRSNALARGEESTGVPSPALRARAMRSNACSARRDCTEVSSVSVRAASMVRNSAARPATGSRVDTLLVTALPRRASIALRGMLTKIDSAWVRNLISIGRPTSCR